MNPSWRSRIQRAQELLGQHAFAAEILTFYIQLASFQRNLQQELGTILPTTQQDALPPALSQLESSALSSKFQSFLLLVQARGPANLAKLSQDLGVRGQTYWSELLPSAWSAPGPSDAVTLLVQAFLQPYAELLRSRTKVASLPKGVPFKPGMSGDIAVCPFCIRKPTVGVMRQMGEGAARSMICSFCLAEWNFRRLVCPGCGEENDTKLPVFTADDFDYIRVECCESCKTYIKTIDLTKNGRAEPMVDELASAPLDLWAREHGYAKLHANLLGM